MSRRTLTVHLGAMSIALLAAVGPVAAQVNLGTDFTPPQMGLQSASVGLAGLNIAFNGGDSFSLHLTNTDENTWIFQLVAVTDQGTFMSAAQALSLDVGADFSAALGGVAGTISSVYFVVSGDVPLPDGDRTSEYDVTCSDAGTVTLAGTDIAGFSMLGSTDPATVTVNNGVVPAGINCPAED